MKIAIVGPSPVPFVMGGIENMLKGLYQTIGTKTNHQVELIKLPSKEHSFWDLIESYYQFYCLDLSSFDVVISSKYPAWMVQHNNCIFYMAHCLRGLYDTYHLTGLPTNVKRGNKKIDYVLDYMEKNPAPSTLDDFFKLLFDLKENAEKQEEEYFCFPGPFIRNIVHYMDQFAFTIPRNVKYYAISKTVMERKEYFPPNANVEVIYLPSHKENCSDGAYKHIFMVSRLDEAKRIDILIKAMKYVKGNINLYIAGTGPQEKRLKKMAAADQRIKFLGFLDDAKIEEYYADSLVIPYFPYNEDYGLITIEAMMHKKPVITTVDSGGPTEFVENGKTGFVTEVDPKQIGEKINYFLDHSDEAERMGQNAYNVVRGITWTNTITKLLADIEQRKKKVTVTSTFPIYPAQGGGQARIFGLYREFAQGYDVEIVSYDNFDKPKFDRMISRGVREIRIPRERQHQEKIWKLEEKAQISLTDVAEITLGSSTKAYREALKNSLESSDFCVISHPYLYYTAKEFLDQKPFIYEAHNVEYIIKKGMLPETRIKEKLLEQVYMVEKECCEKSIMVMTCSEEDRQKLHNIYQIPIEKIVVVPNGVDTSATVFVTPEQRIKNKRKLGIQAEKVGLFMGSWHGPNLDACEMIFKVAQMCPDTKFMLMGSQCNYFKNRKDIPKNVAMLGLVSEEVKNRVFSAVDFALNPMLGGSGTNLKMFDYMSAGIPIITTEFGTRGISNKGIFILANTEEEFAHKINEFDMNFEMSERIYQARKFVENTFDWKIIAKILLKRIDKFEKTKVEL